MTKGVLKILMTGHRGFVGSDTLKFFTGNGIEVVGYDIMDACDVRDVNQLEATVISHQPNRILHLAAIARFAEADKNPRLAFETNAVGTRNVAYISKKYHIPLVYASTGSVYMPIKRVPPITEEFEVAGNSVYGCTKAVGEKFVEDCDAPWIILRYAHLYGKEKRFHGLIGGFLDRIARGLAPTLYGGKQSNDFLYIKDVVRANFLAVTAPWNKWNEAYNIGTGEELSALEAGRIICEVSGYEGKIEMKGGRTVDPERFVYDCGKAERMLGFKAEYGFRQGLGDMLKDGDVPKDGTTLSKFLGKS